MKRIATPGVLLLTSTLTTAAAAQDLVAHHRILDQETTGGITTGTIEVWVGNLTGVELRDVDFRSAQPDLIPGDHGVLQLGAIQADEAGVAVGRFVVSDPASLDEPLDWQVDFDDPVGRMQVIVPSFPLDQE